MTDWNLSLTMVVPADQQDKANLLACALGYDVLPGRTFSVPLSATGKVPATHYGCRSAAKQEFIDMLAAAGNGTLPEIQWADYGLTVDDIAPVLAAVVVDARPSDQADGHFQDVLATQGLKIAVAESAP